MLLEKRVNAKILEGLIMALMVIVGVVAIYILFAAIEMPSPNPILLLVEIMLFQIIAILGLTLVVLKVWEQHAIPGYQHKNKKK